MIAEKFVALTRRAGAEMADPGGPRDPTLVRYIYDLHVTRAHYDAAEVIELAEAIIPADAEAYGHQFPAFRDNPVAETRRAVARLASEAGFAAHYTTFVRDMVYGRERPEFGTALATIHGFGGPVEVSVGFNPALAAGPRGFSHKRKMARRLAGPAARHGDGG